MLQFIKSAYFRSLIEGLPGGVVIFNVGGRAYAANASASELLDLPREELLARTWDTLFPGQAGDPELSGFLLQARDPDQRPEPVVIALPRPGGVRMLSLARSVMADYGKVFGLMLQMSDLTAVYQAHERERRLLEANSQLERTRVEALRGLAMSVAHQIRNPAMIIGNFARMLTRAFPANGPEAEKLAAIQESGARLERIVAAVSQYCALRPGQSRELSLARLVVEAREEAESLDEGRARWEIAVGRETVAGDGELLRRVVAELFRNALEAAGKGAARIEVRSFADRDLAVLEVRDHGPGVPPGERPFLLHPFHTTRPDALGMGLCLAQRIAAEHGGGLSLAFPEDGGLAVRLTLPRPGTRSGDGQATSAPQSGGPSS